MFEIANEAEFDAGLAEWFAQAEALCISAYKGLAAYAYNYVIEETPQYSGETVSNWSLNAGSPLPQTESGIKGEFHSRRLGRGGAHTKFWSGNPNMEAMELAMAHRDTGLAGVVSLDEKIYIVNATTFDGRGDRTVADLEDPPAGWLRAVNQPGHMIGRAMNYVGQTFSNLDATALSTLMRSYA